MGIEHSPNPEEIGLSEEEQRIAPEEGAPPSGGFKQKIDQWGRKIDEYVGVDPDEEKPTVIKSFEKYSRDIRNQVGARDNEPVARAWFRKKFGWPKDPEQGS